MNWIANNRAYLLTLICFVIFVGLGQGEKASGGRGDAIQTVRQYVHLRLRDADWKEYSKLITWPDEPSWDCKWVVSASKLGAPLRQGQKVVIPVVYSRLGLFCYDFDFKPDPKRVTINYELVKRPNGWRVDAPVPDYPDIDRDVLIKSLNATARDANETAERRTSAAATAQKIVTTSDR